MLLENKVAIVTGGSSGLGLAITRSIVACGGKVVVGDIDESAGAELAAELNGVAFLRCDVASADDNGALVRKALDTFGALDIAVNNAGISGPFKTLLETDFAQWKKTFAVNVDGVFLGMRAQIPAMLRRGRGSIINMGSIASKIGCPVMPSYIASKHAVDGLSKQAALDFSARGIRINVVGPGIIETPFVTKAEATGGEEARAVMAQATAMHPIGRLGRPEEVAGLVCWLASDEASFCTGGYYPVHGGYLAH
jgi:NAD(P)-dependent dehydrogenase (short-subunit alcohol dehydrogenase family)